jgi:O-methyltransferase domain/Dimerisation domain
VDLRRAVNGYQVSQALHVAAALGIADLLADGPQSSDELAAACGAHPDSLYRLLRALASIGVLDAEPERRFALTAIGEELRSDVPGSEHAHAVFVGRDYHWNAWSQLEQSVRTGEPAFRSLYGMSVWEYRAERPEESAIFDRWMTANTETVNDVIAGTYDFSRFTRVVDVGGGRGSLLSAIVRAHPGVRGTLFDQAHVVAGVEIDGVEVVSGSFFETVPRGGDAYVLKWIIHDWDDDEAVAILRTCAAALDGDAQVLLIERDLTVPDASWLDLQMLVMLGGRERTEEEYAALLRAADLEPARATPIGAGLSVFEARAANR